MEGSGCSICNWNTTGDSLAEKENQKTEHLKTRQHTLNFMKHYYNVNKPMLMDNKNDVELSCLEMMIKDLKVVGKTRPNSTCSLTLAITNKSESAVHLVRYEFLHRLACRWKTSDKHNVSSGNTILELPANCPEPYYVTVEVNPSCVGIYQSPLLFQFIKQQGNNKQSTFFIGCEIVVSCSDDIVLSLESSSPYIRKTEDDVRPPAEDIEPGVKPKAQSMMKYAVELKRYKMHPDIRTANEELQEKFKVWVHVPQESRNVNKLGPYARTVYNFLLGNLREDSYKEYYNMLLNLEEVQMDHDIRKYDMKNAVMHRSSTNSRLLTLRVLGLAEKRPSVLKGDQLYVRIAKESKNVEYEGYVHSVQENDLLLGFGNKLMSKYLPNMKFDVRFNYSKYPTNVMLRGLTMVEEDHVKYWLFPNSKHAATCRTVISPTERLLFYNRNIEENHEQRTAIQHIVAGSSLPAPYLLHGPPGTGKTVTLVEAVMQLWKIYSTRTYKSYVLVCTPSNSASDLIAERLLKHLPRTDILRFYSVSRDLKQVPMEIQDKKCFNYNFQNKLFFVPTATDMMKYRIVVSTLCNSARLVSLGLVVNHFTHIFVDECGHAVEPETLSPLVGLLKCRQEYDDGFGGQIVLAGDPMQLGPVIRCRVAQEFNLDKSLLERLMKMPLYSRTRTAGGDDLGQFDPRLLTRLKNNYRSHPAILHEPNRLFYDGELKVCADKLKRESLCHWEGLPTPNFPVLFHGVLGRDMQEAKNPSYFNPQEVSIVIYYVDWLLNTRTKGINIQPKDIGIISPYRQQVHKIKNELQKKRIGNITVGSVDEFQGQERRVIVISTVRSNPDLMTYDAKYQLGFLNNPKRFNVALTRAQCLLIVIGNPNLLSKDVHWNAFLRYCKGNGSYVGANYDDPDEEYIDVLQRFKALNLAPVEQEPVRISHRANQEDPPWRSEE